MTENNTSAASAAANIKVKIMNSVEIPILTRCCFCIPLRKGLITIAYINLALTSLVLPAFSYLIFTYDPKAGGPETFGGLLPQLVIEFVLLIVEFFMTLLFIVGLHMKNVKIMRIYLYFGIFYLVFSTLYNIVLACVSEETINEFFMVISQLFIHFYFMIVLWSSIVKMTRDGSVKYTRSEEDRTTIYT